MTVRSNPRLRTVSSVLRTYITVLHVKQEQKDVMFSAGGKASGGARAMSEVPATPGGVPATPGTPGSMVGSEVGSQVLLPCRVAYYASSLHYRILLMPLAHAIKGSIDVLARKLTVHVYTSHQGSVVHRHKWLSCRAI